MNRTNEETSKWINSQKNLSLRAGLEEANTFFGTFPGDHKTFGTWKESFLRKEKKIKNEAPLQSFGFVSKNLKCEKCQNKFKTALAPGWEKVWSRLSAHLQPFFSALGECFNNFRQTFLFLTIF